MLFRSLWSATILLHADQSLAGRAQLDDWTFTILEWNAGRITGSGASALSPR